MRKKGVQDEIYLAASDLIGIGLSTNEALSAIEIVSNRCFGRSFKRLKKTEDWESEPIDQNTLPDERSVRDMVERIEAAGLHFLSMEIESKEGTTNTITHAADSTTKKSVGKFAFSGDPL